MIDHDQAMSLIREHVNNENIIKHMLALEAVMGGLYDHFLPSDISRDQWTLAGLLHDGDYAPDVPANQQGIMITKWAGQKGYEIPETMAHAMAAHNWHNTGVAPESLMDWAIFCADSLTGLIVATALVLPSKKLSGVTVDTVLKKFREKSFARGTRRDDILMCGEKMGITLEDFVTISLDSMQKISTELGL
jgi:predicted hydrolase (HD superfamily)